MGRQRRKNGEISRHCPLPLMKDEEVIQQQPDMAGITERYTQRAFEFIRDSRENDKPFFLYWAHMYVHLPHYAPDHFLKQSENGDFGAVMACLDWSVGALNAELERLGLADDTMIIFTSDNGGRATHGARKFLPGKAARECRALCIIRALYRPVRCRIILPARLTCIKHSRL
jgi:arylsulfatase A-like enzyme